MPLLIRSRNFPTIFFFFRYLPYPDYGSGKLVHAREIMIPRAEVGIDEIISRR